MEKSVVARINPGVVDNDNNDDDNDSDNYFNN